VNQEIITQFLNKKVKLVKNDFALYGTIIAMDEEYILFETNTKTSLLHINLISEITPID